MNENLKAFLQKASEDDVLKAKFAEINDSVMSNAKAEFVKLAKENGFSFTEADMEPAASEKERLSENELNAVAGGEYSETPGKSGKLYCECFCSVCGAGQEDEYQKTCGCFMGGCGELTALGKKKADSGEIEWEGAKGAKVAFFCALAGAPW